MHFDALTLAAVADELRETVAGGRVQQVVLPDSRSVALEVYAHQERRYLLLSAHPQASRVHLLEHKPRRGVPKETPLLLLLRKYVRSARLGSCRAAGAFERVLFLRFQHPQHGATTLAVEPIGQLSNLVLINADGRILDALVRVPAGENALRVLLPRRAYQLPPPQDRIAPLGEREEPQAVCAESPADADDGGQSRPAHLWRSLLSRYAGVSPSLAREAAWRATGDADAAVTADAFAQARAALSGLWSLADTGEWTPGIAVEGGGRRRRVCALRASFPRGFRADGFGLRRGGCLLRRAGAGRFFRARRVRRRARRRGRVDPAGAGRACSVNCARWPPMSRNPASRNGCAPRPSGCWRSQAR